MKQQRSAPKKPDAPDITGGSHLAAKVRKLGKQKREHFNGATAMVYSGDLTNMERLLRPLRRELTIDMAGAFLRLKADPSVQARYETLASRNTGGTLTLSQRAELESLVRANSFLTLLKAEAQAFLKRARAA